MPIIDVYAPVDLLPQGCERRLAERLTEVAQRAEGASDPVPRALQDVTGVFVHQLPAAAVHTAATDRARVVRIQITVGAGGLDQAGRNSVVEGFTNIVADVCGDPTQGERTWVVIVEASEGGWGVNGTAYGRHNAADLLG
jgi:phenylpyruvate tautomerase PptA (4-oxalocrotonate tautomerase family)